MTVTVLLTLLFARLRGYRLKPLLKAWWLYPVFAAELIGIFLQLQIFCGNYAFVEWYGYIKTGYMLLYVLPVVAYKVYKPALAGSGFILAGTLLNKAVMAANGGKMPVYPTLSRVTGYFNEAMFGEHSTIHVMGTADTRLKLLSDFIDTGYSVISIGDLLIRVFVVLVLFYTLRTLQRPEGEEHRVGDG